MAWENINDLTPTSHLLPITEFEVSCVVIKSLKCNKCKDINNLQAAIEPVTGCSCLHYTSLQQHAESWKEGKMLSWRKNDSSRWREGQKIMPTIDALPSAQLLGSLWYHIIWAQNVSVYRDLNYIHFGFSPPSLPSWLIGSPSSIPSQPRKHHQK